MLSSPEFRRGLAALFSNMPPTLGHEEKQRKADQVIAVVRKRTSTYKGETNNDVDGGLPSAGVRRREQFP